MSPIEMIELAELIKRLHPQCANNGCQLPAARRLLADAERLVGRTMKGTILSEALWCDQGDHAFSARDPQREHWEREVMKQGTQTGEMIKIPWDVCGPCVAQMRVNQATARHAQPAAPAIPQPDYATPGGERVSFGGLGHEPYNG